MSEMLQRGMRMAIEKRLDELTREKVEKLKREIEAMIPEIVAGIALDLSRHISAETFKDRLVLTVRYPKPETKLRGDL